VWQTARGAPHRGKTKAALLAANIRTLSERDRFGVWRVWIPN